MNLPQAPVAAKPPASVARKIWRILYWGTILAGAWGIVLMLRRAPTPQVTLSPQAAQSAEQKLAALAAPPAPSLSPSEPQRITLTEEEANSLLAERILAAGGMDGAAGTGGAGISKVKDMKVTFSDDRVRIFGLFNVAGKDLTLQIEGRLHVAEGYLRFEPTGGSLGDLALPQPALDAVVSRIFDNPEMREGLRMPQNIRDVRMENGELVIVRQ